MTFSDTFMKLFQWWVFIIFPKEKICLNKVVLVAWFETAILPRTHNPAPPNAYKLKRTLKLFQNICSYINKPTRSSLNRLTGSKSQWDTSSAWNSILSCARWISLSIENFGRRDSVIFLCLESVLNWFFTWRKVKTDF